jgi:hypothetical protein
MIDWVAIKMSVLTILAETLDEHVLGEKLKFLGLSFFYLAAG